MASRKIEHLSIVIQPQCLDFIHAARMEGIDLLVYCTHRSSDEQTALYEQGRTKAGLIVTHAEADESPHNCTKHGKPAALAFDCVPIIAGKPAWTTTDQDLQRWQILRKLAMLAGLEWGGDWKGAKCDRPHFQLRNWKELNHAENRQPS